MPTHKMKCGFCSRRDFKNAAGKAAHERTAHHEEYYAEKDERLGHGHIASAGLVERTRAAIATEPPSAPPDDLAVVKQKWMVRREQIHQELVHLDELKAEDKELERLIAGVDNLMKGIKLKPSLIAVAQPASE